MGKSSGHLPKISKVRIFMLLAGLIAVLSLFLKIFFPNGDAAAVVMASGESAGSKPVLTEPAATNPASSTIPIYLVGAVHRPGIYEIERGSYLYELIEIAGGLTSDAAAEDINLALRLDTNQRIHLPTKAEAEADPARFLAAEANPKSSLIEINQADQEKLESLPGIGPATAAAILAYRDQHGSFKQIEDLMKVPGVKESRFNSLKDQIWVKACP